MFPQPRTDTAAKIISIKRSRLFTASFHLEAGQKRHEGWQYLLMKSEVVGHDCDFG